MIGVMGNETRHLGIHHEAVHVFQTFQLIVCLQELNLKRVGTISNPGQGFPKTGCQVRPGGLKGAGTGNDYKVWVCQENPPLDLLLRHKCLCLFQGFFTLDAGTIKGLQACVHLPLLLFHFLNSGGGHLQGLFAYMGLPFQTSQNVTGVILRINAKIIPGCASGFNLGIKTG